MKFKFEKFDLYKKLIRKSFFTIIGIFTFLSFAWDENLEESFSSFALPEKIKFQLLSQNEGYLLMNNKILWTKDFGHTWEDISPRKNAKIGDVYFVDKKNGWAVLLEKNQRGFLSLELAKTFDGGIKWKTKPLKLFKEGDVDSIISHIFLYLKDETGWIVTRRATSSAFSAGSLFKTLDGGDSWERLSIPIAEPVNFLNKDFGWMAGGPCDNLIYKSRDGGRRWEKIEIPLKENVVNFKYKNPKFINSKIWIVPVAVSYGESAFMEFYKTEDGGKNWMLIEKIPIKDEFHPFATYIFDKDKWIAIDASEMKLFEFDGIVSGEKIGLFPSITKNPSIIEMDFFDENRGWALFQEGTESWLCATRDGGASWEIIKEQRDKVFPLSIIYQGQGFDICQLPSPSIFHTWKNYSPYYFVNLYIGGVSRACPNQPYLNKDNLLTLMNQGWQGFVPTWVGPQAPCTNFRYRISYDPSLAYQQGKDEALRATIEAQKLGFGSGEPIYYDLEAYNTNDTNCRKAVKSFINGWVDRLKELGYIPGVYGSGCASGMTDFTSILDYVWLAHWIYSSFNPSATVWNVACVSNSFWQNHQRIRQYTGSHYETYGGVSLEIDCDVSDGKLAILQTSPDNIKPMVNSFDVFPRSINLDDSFTITYTVSDEGGSGLNRVELWRANDRGGSPSDWAEIERTYISGDGPISGSFYDSPQLPGIYWYGLKVIDNAGNWSSEPYPPGPIKVKVSNFKRREGTEKRKFK